MLVAWALRPAWYDPIGRTIILTASAYFVAFSLFTGYFSRFTRGFGGISIQRFGFHWSDLITLLPAGITTGVNLLREARTLIGTLAVHAIGLTVVHVIGLAIAYFYLLLYGRLSEMWREIYFQIVPGLYLVNLFGLLLVLLWKNRDRRLLVITYAFLFISFPFLVILAASMDLAIPPDPPVVLRQSEAFFAVIREFLIVIYAVILALIPLALGAKIAEEAVKQGMLSRVAHLVLQQPLTCLSGYEEQQTVPAEPSVSWGRRWFTKPSFHVSIRPDVYGYCSTPEKPLYLVASFRENLALFEPTMGGDQFDGRLILINQSLVRAIELRSSKKSETVPTKKPTERTT